MIGCTRDSRLYADMITKATWHGPYEEGKSIRVIPQEKSVASEYESQHKLNIVSNTAYELITVIM